MQPSRGDREQPFGFARAGPLRLIQIGLQANQMIDKNIENQFYGGNRTPLVPFVINDAVEIIEGRYSGKSAAVISIVAIEPAVTYLIELGDGSGDVMISAKALKLTTG